MLATHLKYTRFCTRTSGHICGDRQSRRHKCMYTSIHIDVQFWLTCLHIYGRMYFSYELFRSFFLFFVGAHFFFSSSQGGVIRWGYGVEEDARIGTFCQYIYGCLSRAEPLADFSLILFWVFGSVYRLSSTNLCYFSMGGKK